MSQTHNYSKFRKSLSQQLLEKLRFSTPPLPTSHTEKEKKIYLYPIRIVSTYPYHTEFSTTHVYEELVSNVYRRKICHPVTKDVFGRFSYKQKTYIGFLPPTPINKFVYVAVQPFSDYERKIFARTKKLGIEFAATRVGGDAHNAFFYIYLYGHHPRYNTDFSSFKPFKTFQTRSRHEPGCYRMCHAFFETEWPFSNIFVLIELVPIDPTRNPVFEVMLWFTLEAL